MTQLISPAAARPRWRSVLATLALVGAMLGAGGVASASAEEIGTGPGVISGTVTNENGLPIAVPVTASVSFGEGTVFSASTTTDSAGHYEFTNLALGYTYAIQVSFFAYPTPPMQYVSLTAESPSGTANFAFEPYPAGVGTISGHVTLDGLPLADQHISAINFSTSQNASATTDSNGYYELTGLANGDWFLSSWVPGTQPLADWTATITDAAPAVTFDLSYLSWPVGTASIHGVVTDSATGAPIAGVSISAFSDDAPHQSNVLSEENGAYSFDLLPAGNYFLSVWAPGYLPLFVEQTVASGADVTRDIAVIAANSTISGHVVGPDGLPAADVYVSAYSDGPSGSSAGTATDANGDYTLTGLGAIQYTVRLGGPGTPFDPQEKVVTPPANGDATVNFSLVARTTAYLTGYVLGPDGEWSNSPVCVTLYSSKNKKPLANQATFGPDFGDGTFAFDNLKPGSYTVEFRDCDDDPKTKFDKVFLGGVKNYKDATFVTLVAGQDSYDNSVTLTLRK
jgi:hypothetical protein